jgi:hypothetical protein
MSPGEIPERMVGAYAGCKSYQDSGCVTSVAVSADRQRTRTRAFSTAFARPDRFRFEFRSSHDGVQWRRYIVWAQGADVRTWWDIRSRIEQSDSLSTALAGAVGVSGGSAKRVGTLLMPGEVGANWVGLLCDLKRLEDAHLGAAECFRVRGTMVPPRRVTPWVPAEWNRFQEGVRRLTGMTLEAIERGPRTLWIDKATFLLRRMEEPVQFERHQADTTTDYDPRIDVTIPEEQLQFDPPPPEGG